MLDVDLHRYNLGGGSFIQCYSPQNLEFKLNGGDMQKTKLIANSLLRNNVLQGNSEEIGNWYSVVFALAH